jgi:Tfp pilus assembly protein PilO
MKNNQKTYIKLFFWLLITSLLLWATLFLYFEIQKEYKEMEKIEKEALNFTLLKEEKKEQEKQTALLQKDIDFLRSAFPSKDNPLPLLTLLEDTAKKNSVSITIRTFKDVLEKKQYEFTITNEGKKENINSFLNALESFPYILRIDYVLFENIGEDGFSRMNISFVIPMEYSREE